MDRFSQVSRCGTRLLSRRLAEQPDAGSHDNTSSETLS